MHSGPLLSRTADLSVDIECLSSAERRHRTAASRTQKSEIILTVLVFLVLYPVLVLACTALPTWWNNFTAFKIQKYQASIPSQVYGTYWAVTVSDLLVLKLFPDILIYYGAIYLVCSMAVVAQIWSPLRKFFHKRLTPSVCVGQALLALGVLLLLIGEWCYWFFVHKFEHKSLHRSNAELAARSFGLVGNAVLGLLVLPIAKNGVWSKVFGVSWEGMVVYHQILGYTFLLTILMHMFSWWFVFHEVGSFPSDIFSVPMAYHSDNFTVPLSIVTSFFMFVIMGGLTFHLIRRSNYELFYYLHFFSGIIFLSVLW